VWVKFERVKKGGGGAMGGGPMRLIKMNFVPPPLISDPQAEKEPKKFRKQNSKVAGAFCISTWVGSLVVV